MLMRLIWGLIALLVSHSEAHAFTYKGTAYQSDGVTPLSEKVNFTFSIYDPSRSCLLYQEKHVNIILPSTGAFTRTVGTSTPTSTLRDKPTDPGLTTTTLFASSGVIRAASSTNCTPGYTAAPGNLLYMRVQIYRVTSTQTITLTPDIPIDPVKRAIWVSPTPSPTHSPTSSPSPSPVPYIKPMGNVSQSTLDVLTSGADASTLHHHDSTYVKLSHSSAQNLGTGGIYTEGSIAVGSSTPSSGTQLSVKSTSPTTVAQRIQGATTQSADLLQFTDSTGTIIAGVTASGQMYVGPSDSPSNEVSTKSYVTNQISSQLSSYAPNASIIPSLDASKITSGTFSAAQIPSLDPSAMNWATISTNYLPANKLACSSTGGVVKAGASGAVCSPLATSDIPNLAWSKITTGKPSTLYGYGITDSITNGGGAPSIQSGLDHDKPTSGFPGRVYIASDSRKIYRDSGTQWEELNGSFSTASMATSVSPSFSGSVSMPGTGIWTSDGDVGIGTTAPEAKLEIQAPDPSWSALKIVDGSQGAGKVLMSDAYGNAKWQTPNAGTVTSVSGSGAISVLTGTTTPAISIATASASTTGALSSTDWSTFNNKLGTGLTSGQLFVGNATNTATGVDMSGDATISNAGLVTLKNTGTSGTYAKVTTDAQGRVTAGSTLTSSDIPNLDASKITSGTFTGSQIADPTLHGNITLPGTGIWNSSGNVGIGTTSPGSRLQVSSTNTATIGTHYAIQITPTYNQITSTAANTDLLINRTQTALGSGAQNLIDAQVAGVSQFSVNNTGTVTAAGLKVTGGTPASGKVLTSDASGNASWQPAATPNSFSGSLAGDVTGTQSATSIAATTVTGKVLTGFTSGAGTVSATDSILSAIQKLNGNDLLKATIASPALTGTPTAPTAAANTNTTQIATTEFVLGQASSTSPSMNGTATVGTGTTFARADHIHPTDSSRAPAASPTFTGNVTLPGTGIWNSSGNVGIGTNSPGVSLDVSGAIRAGSSTGVTTCGAGQANGEGSQRYNYTAHAMEYCNGSSWTAVSSGSGSSGQMGVALKGNSFPTPSYNSTPGLVTSWNLFSTDSGSWYNSGSSKVTVPTAGNYLVSVSLRISNASGSTDTSALIIYKNGSTTGVGDYIDIPTGKADTLHAMTVLQLSANDYIQIYNMQSVSSGVTMAGTLADTFTVWKMP